VVLIAVALALTADGGWLAQMWGSYTDILIGCLVAQLLHRRETYERLAVLGRPTVAWAVFIGFGLSTLIHSAGAHVPVQVSERLFSVVAAAALIALVTNQRGPATLMSAPWLVRIGVWSYAIYLTHGFIFDAVDPLLPAGRIGDCLTLVVSLAIDLPLVWLLHIWVEKPLIDFGKRLASAEMFVTRDNTVETVPVTRRRA
jgi:peptidoglycan/LPS O-acetylase OafA/YrhL